MIDRTLSDVWVLCSVDRASLYSLVHETNLVRNILHSCLLCRIHPSIFLFCIANCLVYRMDPAHQTVSYTE